MVLSKYYLAGDFTKFEPDLIAEGAKPLKFQAGEFLLHPQDLSHVCYYIKSGVVSFSLLNDNGGSTTMMLLGPGIIHPFVCDFYDFALEKYIFYKAITPVSVLALPPTGISNLISKNSDIGIASAHYFCKMLNVLLARDLLLKGQDALYMVCSFLYLYSQNNPENDKNIHLSQEEIASIIGISRVQVTRVFQRLRKEEIIRTSRRVIKILDYGKLEHYCSPLIYEDE